MLHTKGFQSSDEDKDQGLANAGEDKNMNITKEQVMEKIKDSENEDT